MSPIATASLPAKVVLAIIAFNVVMSLWAKRKQKQAAAEAKDPAGAAALKEEARRRMENARARSQAERQSKEARNDDAADSARAKREKALEVGKDILGQLAKELGLELPQNKPAPRPQPARAAAPKPAPAAARKPARGGEVRSEGERPASLKDLLAAQKAAASKEGEGAPRRAPYNEPIPAPLRQAAPLIRPEDLRDPEALRRAFVLKTILDKPLSLQGRRH
jgi:hypothetical protein